MCVNLVNMQRNTCWCISHILELFLGLKLFHASNNSWVIRNYTNWIIVTQCYIGVLPDLFTPGEVLVINYSLGGQFKEILHSDCSLILILPDSFILGEVLGWS